ncbi:hypothetical protein ACQ4PT_020321 [Festuca glaucescens]
MVSSGFLFLLLIIIGVSHDEATSLGFLFFLHMLTTSSGFLFFLHMLTTSSSFLFFLLLIIIGVSHDEATSLGFLFFLHMLTTSSGFHNYDAAPAASWRVWDRSGPDADDGGGLGLGSAGVALGETMDVGRDEVQEEFMANLISGGILDDGGGDDDVTASYLNDSGEGAEDLERREDGSGEEEDHNGSADGTLVITKSTEPSGSSNSSVKSKRGLTKKLSDGVRFNIVEIDQNGRPTAPDKAAKLFISQCGVIVRDCILITVREWHKPKGEAEAGHYVDDVAKNNLWRRLMAYFNLPLEENVDRARQMEETVKEFALKKMAELFKNHKKRLHHDFVKQKKTPDFTGGYEKIKDQWPEFVKYTESEEFKKRSATNKANAALKKYHQITGPGGYMANRPKWQAAEAELVSKGIQIGTFDWTERSKEWFYGIGGRLDPETGKCIYNKEHLNNPCEALIAAHRDVREGRFHPERENDELTRTLGNKEHGGRTRGTEGSVPWKYGFPAERKRFPDKSHARRKAREADRIASLEESVSVLKAQVNEVLTTQRSQGQYVDTAFNAIDPQQSQHRKSSVASTQLIMMNR